MTRLILVTLLFMSSCVTKNLDVIECRKLCYPAQAITPPLNYSADGVLCRCLWPASQGDAGITNPPAVYKEYVQ